MEIARINWVFQVFLTWSKNIRRGWPMESFTSNNIKMNTLHIGEVKI